MLGSHTDIVSGVLRARVPFPILLLVLLAAGCSLGDRQGAAPSFTAEGGDSSSLEGLERFSLLSLATANTTRLGGRDAADDAAAAAVASYPGTSEQTRPSAVMLVDEDNWQGAVAASVLSGRPIGAPMLVTDGGEMPEVSEASLEQLNPTGSDLSRDAQVIKIGSDPPTPEDFRTALIGGEDPYALAAAVDRFSTVARGEPSANVIVASGEQPEYALPAGAWAARSGDSVLFTEHDRLPAETERALAVHERPNIYVLGPEEAVSRGVSDRLRRLGNVRRIEGPDPVKNAVAFARYRHDKFGWGVVVPGFQFTIANANRPLDAAAAAPLATNGIFAPLLITEDADTLPPPIESYFLDVRPGYEGDPRTAVYNHVWLLGDTSAIGPEIQGRLDEIARLIPVQLEGEDAPAQPGQAAPRTRGEPRREPRGEPRRGSKDEPRRGSRKEPRRTREATPGRGPRSRDD
ncbi:MAG TPA: cell wall-binding repeat-containing protein [Thermoleophilaceae bacterium]|nr:cell wall-binding repeat-containing protein [Thermoleophilaceae bacterium]